jgi:hypothetical protein
VSTTPDERSQGQGDDGSPLSEGEIRLVNRLFSDPLAFPQTFKAWLKSYIESSGIQIPASSILGGIGHPGQALISGLPPGLILPHAAGSPPVGSLACNGQAVSRSSYANLFTAIGTTWGTGDGSTTFNVPDLRDRALFGVGSLVTLGQTDGVAYGTRGPKHHHNVGREVVVLTPGGTGYSIIGAQVSFDIGTTGGGGQDAPAFAGVTYIIVTGQ